MAKFNWEDLPVREKVKQPPNKNPKVPACSQCNAKLHENCLYFKPADNKWHCSQQGNKEGCMNLLKQGYPYVHWCGEWWSQ